MYRVVHNPMTGHYRVEKHALLGWSFVEDRSTGGYVEFSDLESARCWIHNHTRPSEKARRWQVVTDCNV
jgi:hypothetical protein